MKTLLIAVVLALALSVVYLSPLRDAVVAHADSDFWNFLAVAAAHAETTWT